ncbi:Carnitinyl-CoA dehydratase [compost metagenome]
MVNYVVPQTELIAKAEEILNKIKQRAPLAVAAAIKSVNSTFAFGVNGFETEIKEFGKCFNTEDFKEGTTAFLEKRKPVFSGK